MAISVRVRPPPRRNREATYPYNAYAIINADPAKRRWSDAKREAFVREIKAKNRSYTRRGYKIYCLRAKGATLCVVAKSPHEARRLAYYAGVIASGRR